MVKKTATQKKNDKLERSLSYFLQIYDEMCLSDFKKIPIMCLDVSSSFTGVIMMESDINDKDGELPNLLPIKEDVTFWNKSQTVISPEVVPYGTYPYVYFKLINFRINLNKIIEMSEILFMEKNNIDPNVFYSKINLYPKFIAVESVFLFQKSAIINLTRFQNTAIGILIDRGYIPFEYDNQEAKSLLGAMGKKEFVTPLINDMYGIEIPETEAYSHVSDAIALGYYHNYIMRKAIRER